MTASHLVGAAVVGLWLATGEKLLWYCLRAMARLVGLRIGAGLVVLRRTLVLLLSGLRGRGLAPRPAGWTEAAPRPMVQRLLGPAPRRGPPMTDRPLVLRSASL